MVALGTLDAPKATMWTGFGRKSAADFREAPTRRRGFEDDLPMRAGRWREEMRQLRAASLHGVLTVAELERFGMPKRSVYRRCRPEGPWRRLLPGVVLLSNGRASTVQQLAAALRYGGPDAMITGLHACLRHGVRRGPRPGADVHLLIPHQRQLRATEYVTVERTERLPEPQHHDGLRFAPVVRACLDAARRSRDPLAVTELLADAVQRDLCTVSALAAELAEGCRRGSAIPRAVLGDVTVGVRSAAERDARQLWSRTGLPEPWWNASVYDARGELLAVVDGWFDDVALAWEIDSLAFHLSPADYARTVARAARLAAAGVPVVPTLPSQLRTSPESVVRTLRAAYTAAGERPRPTIRAVHAPSS